MGKTAKLSESHAALWYGTYGTGCELGSYNSSVGKCRLGESGKVENLKVEDVLVVTGVH